MPDLADGEGPPAVSAVIVLAAGAGTRMKSTLPKVLHPIGGRALIRHALDAAAGLTPHHLVAVLGHGRTQVEQYLAHSPGAPSATVAVQEQQRGTGHAVACALDALVGSEPLTGTVIVTYGDVPLLRSQTLADLATRHTTDGNAVTVLSATVADPSGYGRIVRDADGGFTGIVEHRDADDDQLRITEINSGVYAFDGEVLARLLPRIGSSNTQGEQYLTDVVGLARADGRRVGTIAAHDPVEIEGVNDRVQLTRLARILNDRIVREHQLAGVTVHDPATTWIHADVTIGQDTEILPGTSLEAGTSIGVGAHIGPDTTLSACAIGDGAQVVRSHCFDARIDAGAQVGPFTYLRPGALLAEGSKVGAYVEVKKSTIGPGAKVPHLSYVGDASVGAGVNFSAGAITANYDGVGKHRTEIGENAFIGTNATLVAPVTVGDGSYVAAGSTVTDAVPPGALGVARGRQHNSTGWVLRKRADTPSEQSARAAGDVGDQDATTTDRPGEDPAE